MESDRGGGWELRIRDEQVEFVHTGCGRPDSEGRLEKKIFTLGREVLSDTTQFMIMEKVGSR
jgi:hypothetical protein